MRTQWMWATAVLSASVQTITQGSMHAAATWCIPYSSTRTLPE